MSSRQQRFKPYWERFPQFFLYPLRPPALLLVLGVGLLGALLPRGGAIALICGLLVILMVATRYGYEALERTAWGELTPPPLNGDTLLRGYGLPLKQIGVFIVAGLALGVAVWLLPGLLALLAFVVLYALLPASVMVLALTHSFSEALRPSALLATVRAMRWHYLALYGLLLLVNAGPSQLLAAVPDHANVSAKMFALAATQAFFTLMSFHLMGYFLLQFRERLGGAAPERLADAGPELPAERFALAERFMAEGNHAAALAEVEDIAAEHRSDIDLAQRVHRTAQLAGDERAIRRTANRLIELAAGRGRHADAASAWLETIGHLPDFRPAGADLYLPLVRVLRQRGQSRHAVALANGFHKQHPDSAVIPELYAAAARIFRDDLDNPAQFEAIRRFLAQRWPEHPDVAALGSAC